MDVNVLPSINKGTFHIGRYSIFQLFTRRNMLTCWNRAILKETLLSSSFVSRTEDFRQHLLLTFS